MDIMMKWDNVEYGQVSLRKADDKVKTLANMHNMFKFTDETGEIDASKLFQRLVIVAQSDRSCDVPSAFQYELSVYPTSFFRDGMMRKPDKPGSFRTALVGLTSVSLPPDAFYVIDGGCLLHMVRWLKGQTFGQLTHQYALFVLHRFGQNSCVVFDGYSGEASTKDHEHMLEKCRKLHRMFTWSCK
jgi:hypothetical protein